MTRAAALALSAAMLAGGAAVAQPVPFAAWAPGAALPELFARLKPSVVAIGTLQPARAPSFEFRGTGFAIGDGTLVATNAHVLPAVLDEERRETIAIAIPAAEGAGLREARLLRLDRDTDLAVLRVEGPRLPAAALAAPDFVREGSEVVLIGFPLGSVLGLQPAIHRGLVAAIAPVMIPTQRAQQLDARAVQRLRTGPLHLYQLDAVAFPGNSGSPLVDARTGTVIGVVNQVVVRGAKESALPAPSGIGYAVPIRHLHELLRASP